MIYLKLKDYGKDGGGYGIVDEEGQEVFKSFHKEETGFAEFHTLNKKNWCVKRYNTPLLSLNSEHNLYPIQQILKRQKETINIEDTEQYKQVTIQVKNRGVIHRETLYGSQIGTKKQFKIKKGQFLISKIDARNGAYGIVPDELDGAIITGNFWVYEINTDLVLPEFLNYLMRHEFFNQMCNVCSYGSTNRWYLDEDTFNNFKLPLPSLEEQKIVYKNIKKHLREIQKAQELILSNEMDISSMINDVVGK